MGIFQSITSAPSRLITRTVLNVIKKYAPMMQSMSWGSSRGGATRTPYGYMSTLVQSQSMAIASVRVSEGISALKWHVLDSAGEPVEENPVIDLFNKPNTLTDWTDFVEVIVLHLITTGRAYVLKDPISQAGTPMELWLLRPDLTLPVIVQGQLAYFAHTTTDGRHLKFKPEQIEYIKLANPFDPVLGMGRAAFMETAINIDTHAGEYNAKFFENGATLGTVLEADNDLGTDLKKGIISQFKEMHQAAKNAYKTIILDNGLKLNKEASGTSPKEADFLATRKQIGGEIRGLLSVPPIKAGEVENANRSNSETQDIIFNRDALGPFMRKLTPPLSRIASTFGDKWTFVFDAPDSTGDEVMGNISALGFDRGAVSPNDFRVKVLGWDPVDKPGMDDYYMLGTYLPVAAPGADPAATGTGKPAGEGDTGKSALEVRFKSLGLLGPIGATKEAEKFPQGTATQRRVLAFLLRHQPALERRVRVGFVKYWTGQEELMVSRWMKKSLDDVKHSDDTASLSAAIMPIYRTEMSAQFSLLATLFDLDTDFDSSSPRYLAATGRLARKLKDVADITKDNVEAVIKEGMTLGLTPEQIADGAPDMDYAGIRGTFNQFRKERAMLIARTESGRVQDQASLAAYDDMQVKVLDVIGCQDFVVMPGQTYGCNSQGIPSELAKGIEFHPNHRGKFVPRIEKAAHTDSLFRNYQPSAQDLRMVQELAGVAS